MSALNFLIKKPVIPFIRKKEEKDIRTITLEHTVTVNIISGGITMPYREKRTASLIIAEDDDPAGATPTVGRVPVVLGARPTPHVPIKLTQIEVEAWVNPPGYIENLTVLDLD